jgi:chemotaxis family two-component system response regulator Rcp1
MPWRTPLSRQPVEILLVEDNPGDVHLMEEALKEGGFGNSQLSVARDGEQAIAFLYQESPFENSPRPTFILLDLNLPLKSGREVLAEIKKDEHLRQIPVFILSTSTHSDDVDTAYALHANCYIPKPIGVAGLVEVGKPYRLSGFAPFCCPPPSDRGLRRQLLEEFLDRVGPSRGGYGAVASAASFSKNFLIIILAVPSIRRWPTAAIVPPTCASPS